MGEASRLRARAAEIADEVLFPAALAVDAADRVPASQLDLLAAEGFYGVAARADGSGMDFPLAAALVETFASGCLTTAFVWLQHHGPVLAAADSERPGIRETWLEPLAKGYAGPVSRWPDCAAPPRRCGCAPSTAVTCSTGRCPGSPAGT
ncbi:acyl-CoA dehydrogenase family protein [Catellatospora coxensis]